MKEYDWFRIHVKKNDGNSYSIYVTSSLDSREFDADFAPPFNQRQARELLRQIEGSLKPRAKPLGHERLMKFGRSFYGSIFSAEVEKYFRECLKNATDKARGLRIELIIDPLYLRRLPWELMHDGKDFLALSTATPIVRTVSQAEMREFPAVSFPLGILFVAASPVGPGSPVDVGGEIRLLCRGVSEAVEASRVLLKCYGARKIKSQDFLDDIRSGKFHVLHVSSHGAFVEAIDKGLLQLEDEEGKAIPVSVDTLGAWIKDSKIQMVYLNACQTAVGSVRTPLADLSHVFLDRGVGAVVAMQFTVPDQSAITFCETFYSQLAKQEPLEWALSEARKRTVDPTVGLEKIDWAIPTLHIGGKAILRVRGEREAKESYKPLPELGMFVGRDKELNQLTESLVDSEVSVISVDGFGGIGKSTTVNKLVGDIRHLFTDVCWIDCRPKISHDEVVEEINEMLIVHDGGFASGELAKYSPDGKNDRIAYALEERDNGFLVVFDNFDSVKDDEAICSLVQKIGEGKRSKVFVTLRTPISLTRKQRLFRLDRLGEDDSFLFMRRLGEQHGINSVKRAEKTVLKDINARVDGHPQAIGVVIPRLKTEPLKTVLDGLPRVLAGKIAPILKWSFNLLTTEEREFLLEISVYEGEVGHDALEAVHVGDYPIPVAELVEKNLLTYDSGRELYSLHPLVQEYAYDQLERERRRKLHRLAARYFMSEEVKDPVNAIYHMYKAEDWKAGIYVTTKILDTLILRGFWTEAKNLCEQGLSASRKTKDAEVERYFLSGLGNMCNRLGDYGEAEKLYKKSLDFSRKLGDQGGIAYSLYLLATIEENTGNYGKAKKLYKKSLKIFQGLGDKGQVTISKGRLAQIKYSQGKLKEAQKLHEENLEIYRKLKDKIGISSTLHSLAMIQQEKGNYKEAEKLYKQSLKITRKIGDRSGIASTLHQLAITYRYLDSYEKAIKFHEEALAIHGKLGDREGISKSLHAIGIVQEITGNYEEAEKLYKQSLEIAEKLRDKSEIALLFGQLGSLSDARNQLTLAKEYYEKALEMFRELEEPSGISKALHDLAGIEQARGNYHEATKLYKQSLEIKQKLGLQSGISASLHQLAMIEQARGNYHEATKLYKQSLEIDTKLGDKRGVALSFGALGSISDARNQLTLAKEYYEKALEMFRQLGDKPYTDLVKKNLNQIKTKIEQQK